MTKEKVKGECFRCGRVFEVDKDRPRAPGHAPPREQSGWSVGLCPGSHKEVETWE